MTIDHRTRSLDDEGRRKFLHPNEVSGRWHARRARLQSFLIVFFLCLPWMSIGGRPVLRLDILERRFTVAGMLFRAHDVPIFFLVVIAFVLLAGLLTALFGRVWCGWACPQTVFIERVFRRIESWTEGNAFARREADRSPPTLERIGRKILKWAMFSAATLVITHSFIALFVGPEKLGQMISAGPGDSPGAFAFMLASSAVILLNFGWFREQFCIVVCPYGRIQSVFQDTRTVTVAYDPKRGEPRGGTRKGGSLPARGDCVDCSRCVQVCPTGIDIRNGSSQLECVACTACIDACDDVMRRLGKPKGLIRYASTEEIEAGPRAGRWRRGRVFFYAGAFVCALSGISLSARGRTMATVEVLKGVGAPYALFDTETVGNGFVTEISGHSPTEVIVTFSLIGEEGDELVMPNNPISLSEGDLLRQPFTIRFRRASLRNGRREVAVRIDLRSARPGVHTQERETQEKRVVLIGPF